jgi:hypothetical protein
MLNYKIPSTLQILLFLIPLNIYVIGDWIGSGIQTLFFRYQQTNIGNSIILLNREISFVFNGILSGKSAIATIVWCMGVAFICIATMVIIYANIQEDPKFIRYCAILNIGGAILFSLAIFIQYGIMLHGPAGIAIPFGIPVILGAAFLQYRWNPFPDSDKETKKIS